MRVTRYLGPPDRRSPMREYVLGCYSTSSDASDATSARDASVSSVVSVSVARAFQRGTGIGSHQWVSESLMFVIRFFEAYLV